MVSSDQQVIRQDPVVAFASRADEKSWLDVISSHRDRGAYAFWGLVLVVDLELLYEALEKAQPLKPTGDPNIPVSQKHRGHDASLVGLRFRGLIAKDPRWRTSSLSCGLVLGTMLEQNSRWPELGSVFLEHGRIPEVRPTLWWRDYVPGWL